MPFWSKKEEPLRNVILDTDQELRRLRRKYEMIFERELQIARMNKERTHKRRSNSNYAKIAIAYYSLYMINETQWKLQDIAVNSELNQAMDDLDKAFRIVNKLEGRIGDVPVERITKNLNKMEGYEQFREENYADTYKILGEHMGDSDLKTEDLVSSDVIKSLIDNNDDLDDLLDNREGIKKSMDKLTENDDMYEEMKKRDDARTSTNEASTEGTDEVREPKHKKTVDFDGQLE